jgi:hypothetical protein
MLIRFENAGGGVGAVDVFEIVSAMPAASKGTAIVGQSLVQLRGMPFGTGVLVAEGAESILQRVNAAREDLIRAQAAAAAGRVHHRFVGAHSDGDPQ